MMPFGYSNGPAKKQAVTQTPKYRNQFGEIRHRDMSVASSLIYRKTEMLLAIFQSAAINRRFAVRNVCALPALFRIQFAHGPFRAGIR